MDNERYTIGEISDLLGVTTHMLRHYEKMGIIQPEVNPENGYRYYTVIDSRRFNLSRSLLSCGISLEQCADIMSDISEDAFKDAISHAIEKQLRQIKLSHISIEYLQQFQLNQELLPQRVNQLWIEERPAMWRLNVAAKEEAFLNHRTAKQRQEWLECYPAIYWVSRIKPDLLRQFKDKPVFYEFGLMCEQKYALELGLEQTDDVEIIPAGRYLTTIHEKSVRGPFVWQNIHMLTSYLNEHQIHDYGDMFSHIVASNKKNGKVANYHKVYLQINE